MNADDGSIVAPQATRRAALITLAFVLLQLPVVARHELWRDEMAAWLTVRDSNGPLALLDGLAYGGHPALWYLLLDILHFVNGSPVIMQVASTAIAAAAVYVVARWSPLSWTNKLLFAGGYFVFYEYSVLARNYGIGMLLAFVACVLYPARRQRWWALSITIALLAQTNIFGTILALAFMGLLAWDWRPGDDANLRVPSVPAAAGFGLMMVAVLSAVALSMPPSDSGYATEWFFRWDAGRFQTVGIAIRNGLLPLPAPVLGGWERNVVHLDSFRPLANIGLALLTLRVGLHLITRPLALAFTALAACATIAFCYVKYAGLIRHHGYLFVILVMGLWLASHVPDGATAAKLRERIPRFSALPRLSLSVLLLLHVIGNLSIVRTDWRAPFTTGKAVAAYLEANQLTGLPIVAHHDYAAASVLGYANIRSAYYPEGRRDGSFVIWDAARMAPVSFRDIFCAAWQRSAASGGPALLLTNHGLPTVPDGSAVPLQQFTGAMVHDENFLLTRINAKGGEALAGCATSP